MIFSNIWAMTHDENVYPDPYTFKPERFFNEDGKLNDDSRILAYGFGRRSAFLHPSKNKCPRNTNIPLCDRICVGKEIATDMVGIVFFLLVPASHLIFSCGLSWQPFSPASISAKPRTSLGTKSSLMSHSTNLAS